LPAQFDPIGTCRVGESKRLADNVAQVFGRI
jgi:hypothetical protein